MNRMQAYAQLVRLPNLPTALADILLGFLATGSPTDWRRWPTYLLLMAASACLYCGGMVWNDYFDRDLDKRERPERPIPSGKITPRQAALCGAGLVIAGIVLAFLAGLVAGGWVAPTVLALLLTAAIFLYDGWLKRTVVGPVAMGACRFLNVMLGVAPAAALLPTRGVYLAFLVGLYIVGVTWLARTEARVSNRTALIAAAGVMLAEPAAGAAAAGAAAARRAAGRRQLAAVPVPAGRPGVLRRLPRGVGDSDADARPGAGGGQTLSDGVDSAGRGPGHGAGGDGGAGAAGPAGAVGVPEPEAVAVRDVRRRLSLGEKGVRGETPISDPLPEELVVKLKLTVISGPHQGQEFVFDGHDTFLVGRTKDAHFRLSYDDPYFSRRHFLVEVNPPRCRVIDLNSRNGILLNGARVQTAEVADGDEIAAGHTVFKVCVVAPAPHEIETLDMPARPAAASRPATTNRRRPASPATGSRASWAAAEWASSTAQRANGTDSRSP